MGKTNIRYAQPRYADYYRSLLPKDEEIVEPKSSNMKTFFANLVSSLKGWKLVTVLIAIIIAWLIFSLSSCSTSHMVRQTSTSESYVRGDTTVTSVTIKYEQVGESSKR